MTEEDSKKPRMVFVDDWRKAWKEGRNNWHLDHVHPWVISILCDKFDINSILYNEVIFFQALKYFVNILRYLDKWCQLMFLLFISSD